MKMRMIKMGIFWRSCAKIIEIPFQSRIAAKRKK
jgi:hypothetical protein